jgi:hypothetical protein
MSKSEIIRQNELGVSIQTPFTIIRAGINKYKKTSIRRSWRNKQRKLRLSLLTIQIGPKTHHQPNESHADHKAADEWV